MKFIRYMIRPLEIVLLLTAIALLIYFRAVIFHPNVNQYVDEAQAYIENKLDITIPVYVSDTPAITEKIVYVEVEVPVSPVIEETVSEPSEVEVSATEESVEIINEAADDSIKTTSGEEVVVSEPIVITDDMKEMVESEQVENKSVSDDLLLQLTDTVNALNTKVDKLYDEARQSVVAAIETQVKDQEVQEQKTELANESKKMFESSSDVQPEQQATKSSSPGTNAMLKTARQSYWTGNSQGAEKIYLNLVAIEDTNPDIYGELGNVYYTQGKWKEAGQAYYEAAVRLLALDKNIQVNYLLRVIQGLDAESAEKLKQKISG